MVYEEVREFSCVLDVKYKNIIFVSDQKNCNYYSL